MFEKRSMSTICHVPREASRGVFWYIDGKLFAFSYRENAFTSSLAASGNTYVHKKLWAEARPKGCNKPYNYFPRGRVEINSKGKAIIYMNPHIEESIIPEIMTQFGLKEHPEIIYDNSFHYRCHLDNGWKADR